jgi:lauroyl/myristoyl acyltransferase
MRASLRRFAVRGVFWRQYLDWAIINAPFYMHFVLLCFWTLFFYFFAAPARRAVVVNLGVVLRGSSRVMNHVRALRTLYNFAWTITDAAVHKLTKAVFDYEISGARVLDELGAARGAIVLTAHMGSYDLGAALFAEKFNRQIRMVRAPEPDRQTEEHLKASLTQAGEGAVKVDYNTAGALLSFDLLNALRQGEIVSIQGDRVIGDVAQIEGTIFGRTISVPTGPFILAQVAEVAIFPLFIARTGYRRYAIIVREPIRVARVSADRNTDISAAVAQWCSVLQTVVAEHWEQWFAFAPIFVAHEKR